MCANDTPRASPKAATPHRCVLHDTEYMVHTTRLRELGPRGEGSRIRVLTRSVGEEDWTELSMSLTWWSRIAHSQFATWPPEGIDWISCEHGRLILQFRDRWVPYEKPVLPFGLDRESLWQAVYLHRTRSWSLRRIRHLDYERDHGPPVLGKDDARTGFASHTGAHYRTASRYLTRSPVSGDVP